MWNVKYGDVSFVWVYGDQVWIGAQNQLHNISFL